MAQRIIVTERVREGIQRLLAMATCQRCGDDLDLHEWFDVQQAGTRAVEIVRCDRQD